MSEPKTSVEILQSIARKTGRHLDVYEMQYPAKALDRLTLHKRVLVMEEEQLPGAYLIWYSDPRDMTSYSLYSGIFLDVNLSAENKFDVRKRNIADKLNPGKKSGKVETGNPAIDKKIVVSGDMHNDITSIIRSDRLHQLILDAFKLDQRFVLGVNKPTISYLKDLRHKSLIGLFTNQFWMTESKQVENVWELGRRLNELLIG